MISCHHCGHDSKVIETRTVLARMTSVAGQRVRRTRTVCRRRQCKNCNYRWNTMEVPMRHGSRTWKKVAKEKVSRRIRLKTPAKHKES